ncbi:MAG: hypothetical protein BYD32DRAFT_421652, partial [Podila humilis]
TPMIPSRPTSSSLLVCTSRAVAPTPSNSTLKLAPACSRAPRPSRTFTGSSSLP